MEIHLLSVRRNFCTGWGQFSEHPCDQTSGHIGYHKYQKKGMDIIFKLIPLCFLWVKWFGYYSHSKSSMFSKSWKCGETQLFGHLFFQMAAITRIIWILTWNQSQMKLKTPNFHGKKEACWFVEPLLRYQSLKSGLILYAQKPRWISISV